MIKNILLSGTLFLCTGTANAAIINIIETFDAFLWATTNVPYSQNHTIEVGDTVNFDVNFANDESIKLTSLDSSGFLFFAARNDAGSSFTISDLSVLLTDYSTNGTGSNTPSAANLSSGAVHLGPLFSKSALGLNNVGDFLQFSGFQVSFLVTSLTNPPVNTSRSFLGVVSNGVFWNAEAVATVPAPAAVWLFGTALIGLVGFGKRKSKTETR